MNAEIISVGTELLLGETVDANSAYLSTRLAAMGVNVYFHTAVGDNPLRLAAVIAQAMTRSDLTVITGGLGPTQDDLTKEALAAVTGRRLELRQEALDHIEGWFKAAGRAMTANNRRQAMFPEGAAILANSRGTAPGALLRVNGVHVVCLPGVPAEMRPMWEESAEPALERLIARDKGVIASRTLRFYGIGESALESAVEDLLAASNPTVAPYAGNGEVRVRVTAKAATKDEAHGMLAPVIAELESRVGEYVYGFDSDNLETVVGRLLTEAKMSLAVAESCTGGLLAHRLTNVAGSSAYFRQGWVAYSNEAKTSELGVDPQLIHDHGAVSEPVAEAMAVGARSRARADVAIGVTGIAGPGGGSEEKPVGTVCFGFAFEGGSKAFTRHFRGDRENVKWRSASEALNGLRLLLEGRA